MPDDQLIEVKDRAAAQFLSRPGVSAVGLGGRELAGRPTGEVVLKVFVARKRPAEELTPGELLPAQFEGIGVDVVEMGQPVLLAGPAPPQPGSPGTSETDTDDDKARPLKGGVQVQVSLTGAGFGTLGCFLTDPGDPAKVYALTNHHVVVVDQAHVPVALSTTLGQPDNQSGPTKCCNHIIGKFAAGSLIPLRDAAVILLDAGLQWLAEITEIGVVAGTHALSVAEVAPLNYQVRKRGMRTRLTGGTVDAINAVSQVIDPTTQQVVVHPNAVIVNPNPNAGVRAGQKLYFSQEGDSGSMMVNAANEVVALLYAGRPAGAVDKGLGLPIADILGQFQTVDGLTLQVATATALGQVQTVPGTPPAAPRPPAAALAPTLAAAGGEPAPTLSRVGRDLGASPAGRALRALWVDHGPELLDLIDTRRRVTLAWHRDGGPALTQSFLRAAVDPGARIPSATAGEPPLARLRRIHAVLHAHASPELRQALDQALEALPDPAGRTYDQLLAAIGERSGS